MSDTDDVNYSDIDDYYDDLYYKDNLDTTEDNNLDLETFDVNIKDIIITEIVKQMKENMKFYENYIY